MGSEDQEDHQAIQARLEKSAHQDLQEKKDHKVNEECRENLVVLGKPGIKDFQVSVEPMEMTVNLVLLDVLDQEVIQGGLDYRDQQDLLDRMVPVDMLVKLVLLATRDHREKAGLLESRELKEPKVNEVISECPV